jgi:hypothetical protein
LKKPERREKLSPKPPKKRRYIKSFLIEEVLFTQDKSKLSLKVREKEVLNFNFESITCQKKQTIKYRQKLQRLKEKRLADDVLAEARGVMEEGETDEILDVFLVVNQNLVRNSIRKLLISAEWPVLSPEAAVSVFPSLLLSEIIKAKSALVLEKPEILRLLSKKP